MNKRTPHKLICVALALVLPLSLLPMSAFAAGEVAIDETNFPDAKFRQYVLDHCDTDKDSTLSSEEISNVTEIDVYVASGGPNGVSEPQIRSLDGIEFFTALTGLDCTGNLLTSLDVSKNTALIRLSCTHNQLTSLDVSSLSDLSLLWCSRNNLTSLNLSNKSQTIWLECNNNQYIINQRKDFDYTTLPGNFDVTKVSNVQGGKFDTDKHTFIYFLLRG